jgi:hypothetical protein
LYYDTVMLENTILAFSELGESLHYDGTGSDPYFDLTCCDIFGNEGGDWVGYIANFFGVDGNISEDPLFCGEENPFKPYALHMDSPCAPFTAPNPECHLIGAWDVACGQSSGTEQIDSPGGLYLASGVPNPCGFQAHISYVVPHGSSQLAIRLCVLDPTGRLVRILVDSIHQPGTYTATWKGTDDKGRHVSAGVYWSELLVGAERLTQRFVLVR